LKSETWKQAVLVAGINPQPLGEGEKMADDGLMTNDNRMTRF